MQKKLTIGILRETKNKWEKRAPLTPQDVGWLINKGIFVEIEASSRRIFKDAEYKKQGARVVRDIRQAELLVGIKAPKLKDLKKAKTYLIFSHTSKGQPANMPLLKKILQNKNSLLDYEKITNAAGKRLVYFGHFAGICGAIDSLYYFGQKLEKQKIRNPFKGLKPAFKYQSIATAKKDLRKISKTIRTRGVPKEIAPLLVGITGHGNVAKGALEMLEILSPQEIHPQDINHYVQKHKKNNKQVYTIVLKKTEKLRTKDGSPYVHKKYLKYPEKYKSNLDHYLPCLNLLIHGSYWDKRFPKMVTRQMLQKLLRQRKLRCQFIGDLSCDVNGGIEITAEATTPDRPVLTYDPKRNVVEAGLRPEGITVLAVDNLPAELPRDSSKEFSKLSRVFIAKLAFSGVRSIVRCGNISPEIKKAVIVEQGKLTPDFLYLRRSLR
ncbi:hypothetical protein ACFL5G_00305 [Candidatus Margulisiibacteriota bacterium]